MPIRNVTFIKPLNDITSNDELMGEGNQPQPVKEGGIIEPSIGTNHEYDDSIWNSAAVKVATSCMGTKTLFNEDKVENTDFVLPVENVMAAQNKFANSLVGFFVGKRVAFLLGQNYVMNK
ncbi:hypothetical protein Tco_1487132 [Tanacetum coccineum]